MTYQLSERPQHKVEIAGRIDADEVTRERKALLRSWAGKVRIPGFRPGKVPLAMLQARIGDQVQAELLEKLAGDVLREVLEGEENLRPLSAPMVKRADIDDDGCFVLDAEMEIRPVIDLRPVEELTLPEATLEVTDAELEAEVEKLQQQHATWDPADEGPAADGMRVDCVFHGESEEDGEVVVHEDDAVFIIGHPELYQEINEAMQGAKTGDTCSATKRFDEDDPHPERAGKTIRFDVTIKSLKRQEVPEADDDLAKTVGFDSFEQLQDRLREQLQHKKHEARHQTWRQSLLEQISEGFDLDSLPAGLVQSTVDSELQHLSQLFKAHGNSSFDHQRFAAEIEPAARRKVLDMLILDQLAGDWEISAEERVREVVAAQAAQLGIPAAEHLANLEKEQKLDGIVHGVRMAAAADELIRRAGGEV